MQDDDARAQSHDQLDVMLDKEDRDAERFADRAHQVAEALDFAVGQSGGGLVEQEDEWAGGERAGDLEALEQRIGQRTGLVVAHRVQPERRQDRIAQGPQRCFLANARERVQQCGAGVLASTMVGAEQNVLDHAHAGIDADVLEGAGDAETDDTMAGHAFDAAAGEHDGAASRLDQPRDGVEQGGLAGTVRADQAANLAVMKVEADIRERRDAVEAHAEIADRQQGIARSCCHGRSFASADRGGRSGLGRARTGSRSF